MKYMYHVFLALLAASASFAAEVKLSTLTDHYKALDGDVLTGTLAGNYKISIADGATVTLKNVAINGTNEKVCNDGSKDISCKWAGLTCLGNCTIVLEGTNTVTGFDDNYPGIQAAKNEGEGREYVLTIEGDGSLDASSNGHGAGIGGGYEMDCGDITISGGNITATGGDGGAGIGGGVEASSGDVTISGGTVTATGGAWAAGIGVGYAGHVEAITINGGEVAAIGGNNGAGIGVGFEGACGNITITNDVTKVVAVKGAGAPYSIGGYDDETGSIDIGDKTKSPIEKGFFIFPAPPAKLVDFETVGGKTYAVIDGDYSGDEALNITKDVSVDKVIFERTFPGFNGEKNYATIMFPFEINADKVGGVKKVFSFVCIDIDFFNRKYVAVEEVDKFEAYKPYLIQLKSEGDISINNTEPLVLKKTPTKLDAFDVAQSDKYNQYGDYVFRGVVQTKTWGAEDDEVLGTDDAAAYGFAATATTDVKVGQFARVGEGAYIRPFRGYIYKKPAPKKVKSNGDYVLRQTASIEELPDVMDIVVVDRKKDGSKQTTVIGQFNSRTGEIRMNRLERTYDLKGRSVRDASHMAKGVYLKK